MNELCNANTKKKPYQIFFSHMDFKVIGKGWVVFRLCGRDMWNAHEVFYMLQQQRKLSSSKVFSYNEFPKFT